MKSDNNDVLMICKGHYKDGKYKCAYEALEKYWCERCLITQISVDEILKYALIPVAREYFSSRQWGNWFEHKFLKAVRDWPLEGLVAHEYLGSHFIEEDPISYACGSLMSALCHLSVRDDAGCTLIDLSGYENDDVVI